MPNLTVENVRKVKPRLEKDMEDNLYEIIFQSYEHTKKSTVRKNTVPCSQELTHKIYSLRHLERSMALFLRNLWRCYQNLLNGHFGGEHI